MITDWMIYEKSILIKEIAIVWSIKDVQSVRSDLNNSEASQVLHHLERDHDVNIGINWEVIASVCDMLFPKDRNQE